MTTTARVSSISYPESLREPWGKRRPAEAEAVPVPTATTCVHASTLAGRSYENPGSSPPRQQPSGHARFCPFYWGGEQATCSVGVSPRSAPQILRGPRAMTEPQQPPPDRNQKGGIRKADEPLPAGHLLGPFADAPVRMALQEGVVLRSGSRRGFGSGFWGRGRCSRYPLRSSPPAR
jgi:hypothetical protein